MMAEAESSAIPQPVPVRVRKLPGLAGVPHVIPYQGSKRALAHSIIPLIPSSVGVFREPFAGSAAVSIAVAHAGLAREIHISDVNGPLMDLWREIISRPQELADSYETIWNGQLSDPRSFYVAARQRFNATHQPQLLLYLLARCVKAAVRYNKHGEFNQGADNRCLGAKPAAMRSRITATARVMHGALVSIGDYEPQLLEAAREDVVYMDPPYEGVSNVADHRYMAGLDRAAFVATLAEAAEKGLSFIISYDGMTGKKTYGEPLPAKLGLLHLHLSAGRSSQATLTGSADETVESLYLSEALVDRLGGAAAALRRPAAWPKPAHREQLRDDSACSSSQHDEAQ